MRETADQWGELMAAAQAGHAAAYRRLLDEIRYWLKGFYARRLPPAMVEDAVQDTLIAIHEKRHTYDPERPFKPWLMAVARYKWIDRLRSMSRSRTEELPEEIGDDADQGFGEVAFAGAELASDRDGGAHVGERFVEEVKVQRLEQSR